MAPPGGEQVTEGWQGTDTGNNWCNTCVCAGDGAGGLGLACTLALCGPTGARLPPESLEAEALKVPGGLSGDGGLELGAPGPAPAPAPTVTIDVSNSTARRRLLSHDSVCICPDLYAPVCGSAPDTGADVTYPNACWLVCVGAKLLTATPCVIGESFDSDAHQWASVGAIVGAHRWHHQTYTEATPDPNLASAGAAPEPAPAPSPEPQPNVGANTTGIFTQNGIEVAETVGKHGGGRRALE